MWTLFAVGALFVLLGGTAMANGAFFTGVAMMTIGSVLTLPAFVGVIRSAWKDNS